MVRILLNMLAASFLCQLNMWDVSTKFHCPEWKRSGGKQAQDIAHGLATLFFGCLNSAKSDEQVNKLRLKSARLLKSISWIKSVEVRCSWSLPLHLSSPCIFKCINDILKPLWLQETPVQLPLLAYLQCWKFMFLIGCFWWRRKTQFCCWSINTQDNSGTHLRF